MMGAIVRVYAFHNGEDTAIDVMWECRAGTLKDLVAIISGLPQRRICGTPCR
jgi:hypothetical protein